MLVLGPCPLGGADCLATCIHTRYILARNVLSMQRPNLLIKSQPPPSRLRFRTDADDELLQDKSIKKQAETGARPFALHHGVELARLEMTSVSRACFFRFSAAEHGAGRIRSRTPRYGFGMACRKKRQKRQKRQKRPLQQTCTRRRHPHVTNESTRCDLTAYIPTYIASGWHYASRGRDGCHKTS